MNCGDAYERANQATDEIWDLVEPTVREAEGWDEAVREADDACCSTCASALATRANPYRSEADHSEELLDEAEHERSRQEGCHG